jgi:hypothetical protein
MKTRIHGAAGAIAMLCIIGFWSSTVVSELFLTHQAVAAVKSGILYAMWVLVPALVMTGASGFSLSRTRTGQLVDQKRRRMPFITLNGLLVLLPSAIFLHAKASTGEFDDTFFLVQALELLAGAVNLTLMGLNLRDGIRLAGHRRSMPEGRPS